jgi:hypothetical protein
VAKKRRKRFNSEKSAKEFAIKVNGKVNDCREIRGAKSPFTVTYERTGIDNRLDKTSCYEVPTEFWI